MPLILFIDALPYSWASKNFKRVSKLRPNVGYSSSLHWELFCNKYPDDNNFFLDWGLSKEPRSLVRVVSYLLYPLDFFDWIAFFTRKVLDKFVFRKNVFANIPFRFRPAFSNVSRYLFFEKDHYSNEDNFKGYTVISQDEYKDSLDAILARCENSFGTNQNIFVAIGVVDSTGHQYSRGPLYDIEIKKIMDRISSSIDLYLKHYPEQEVVIVSDHGMSTVKHKIDFHLEKTFGRQSIKDYIAYSDSCMMCIWSPKKQKLNDIKCFLENRAEGHLISDEEREHYHISNKRFGDLIFNTYEGNIFSSNWFGKGIHKNKNGTGMHGFWPQTASDDQMASIIVLNSQRELKNQYDYHEAFVLLSNVMQGKDMR